MGKRARGMVHHRKPAPHSRMQVRRGEMATVLTHYVRYDALPEYLEAWLFARRTQHWYWRLYYRAWRLFHRKEIQEAAQQKAGASPAGSSGV
jgi:hypothetical protein